MTIEIVRQRLDAAIQNETPKVILLTGGWGAGKTHQWRNALQRAQSAKKAPKFAYVSLFGVGTLAEAKKRLSEELVAAISLPDGVGTVGDAVSAASTKLKPLQMFKLLPLIPYLGKAEGLLNELSFAAVRNAVICIDDLERKGNGLSIADIFGLASFLKEERSCRIILIANDRKLDAEGATDARVYMEKVVDEHVHFAPSPEEACAIALGKNPDRSRSLLRQHLLELGVSNIRVVSRLSQLVAELARAIDGLDEEVLKIGVRALTGFGLGHYLPEGDFPTIEYVLSSQNHDWLRWLSQDKSKNSGEQTEEERRSARWDELLSRLGGPSNDAFEIALATAIQQGYLGSDLRILAEQLSTNLQDKALVEEFHSAWMDFWHSLNGSGNDLLDSLLVTSRSAVRVIGPGDLKPVYDVFVAAGREADADLLLTEFIDAHKATPNIFDRSKTAFPEHFTGKYGERLQTAAEDHITKPSIEISLDRIHVNKGWNPDDVRIVAEVNPAEIERLLRNASGRLFRARIQALLQLGSMAPDEPRAAEVTATTVMLIKAWASADPVTAIRLRQYMPPSEGVAE